MNLVAAQNDLKNLNDSQLQRELLQPSAGVPSFLILSELQRRKDLRNDFQSRQQQPSTSIADELSRGLGSAQTPYAQALTQGQPGAPQQGAQGPPQAGPPQDAMQSPQGTQGFADGGMVGPMSIRPVGLKPMGYPGTPPYGLTGANWPPTGTTLPGTPTDASLALTGAQQSALPQGMHPGLAALFLQGASANGATGSGGDSTGGVSGTGGIGGSASDNAGGSAAAGVGDGESADAGATYADGGSIPVPSLRGKMSRSIADDLDSEDTVRLRRLGLPQMSYGYSSPDYTANAPIGNGNSMPGGISFNDMAVAMGARDPSRVPWYLRKTPISRPGLDEYQSRLLDEPVAGIGELPKPPSGQFNPLVDPGSITRPRRIPGMSYGEQVAQTLQGRIAPNNGPDPEMQQGMLRAPEPQRGGGGDGGGQGYGGPEPMGLGAFAGPSPSGPGGMPYSGASWNALGVDLGAAPPNGSSGGGGSPPMGDDEMGAGAPGPGGVGDGGSALSRRANQSLADFQNEIRAAAPQDRYAEMAANLDVERGDLKKQGEQDKGMALLQAGLGMMAGGSPFAAQNIGAGGMQGVKYWSEASKEMRQAQHDIRNTDAQIAIAQANRDERGLDNAVKMKVSAEERLEQAQTRRAQLQIAGGNRSAMIQMKKDELDSLEKHRVTSDEQHQLDSYRVAAAGLEAKAVAAESKAGTLQQMNPNDPGAATLLQHAEELRRQGRDYMDMFNNGVLSRDVKAGKLTKLENWDGWEEKVKGMKSGTRVWLPNGQVLTVK